MSTEGNKRPIGKKKVPIQGDRVMYWTIWFFKWNPLFFRLEIK